MELDAWVAAVSRELGVDGAVDIDLLLDVARDAAHNVERKSAPVTTYLLGVAVGRGATPEDAAAAVRRALP